MKYQLVIFDSDGTLADTLPWMRTVLNELALTHGFKQVDPDDHERMRDLHGMELLRALELPLWKVPRVLRDLRARMAAGSFVPFPGITDALQQLAGCGLRLGVVSSNSRTNVENVLGSSIAGLIHHYDCGASIFGKASKVKAVVRRSGINPQNVIYVGDEVRDAEAARKAGIAFGAVSWGLQRIETLRSQNPQEIFGTPSELAEKLRCRSPA
jgi:phosphoglycolate phosphatase